MAWYYDWIHQSCKSGRCCRSCCCRRRRKQNNDNEGDGEFYWRIYHKACYGILVMQDDDHCDHEDEDGINSKGSQTFEGITMSQYCER